MTQNFNTIGEMFMVKMVIKDTEPNERLDIWELSKLYPKKHVGTYNKTNDIYYSEKFLKIPDLGLTAFAGFMYVTKDEPLKILFLHRISDGSLVTFGGNLTLSSIIRDSFEAHRLRTTRSIIQEIPCEYVTDTKYLNELVIPYMKATNK